MIKDVVILLSLSSSRRLRLAHLLVDRPIPVKGRRLIQQNCKSYELAQALHPKWRQPERAGPEERYRM
jgi:hypothetical protein